MNDPRFHLSASALLLSALFCTNVAAQETAARGQALEEYQQWHPGARFHGAAFHAHDGPTDEVGTASTIYGAALASGATPLDSAWVHVGEVQGLLADEVGALEPEIGPDGNVIQEVMFDRAEGTHRFSTFRFGQYYAGVPVFRSGAGFLVRNELGYPLVMSTFDVKDLSGLGSVAVDAQSARVSGSMVTSARRYFDQQLVSQGLQAPEPAWDPQISEAQLVVWAGANQTLADPEFAMQFVATRGTVQDAPDLYQRQLFLVSVATSEVLFAENLIHNFTDVNGTVSGRATQGLNALECDPEASVPLPYAEVNVVGGNSTFADVNGQYVIPHGGTSAVTVRSRLRGQYFEVFDESAGGAIPELTQNTTPPGPADFVHNPAPSLELANAGVNAYVEANVVRDYVLSYAPTFPTIANQTFFDVNVNINSSCNAYYDGVSINFYRNGGGCNNTSFSDVVYHEYGHHLINVTGNGQGQLGEGSGDAIGVLIQDDPVLGQGFSTCGQGIRNANNNHQYPCGGAIHDCGQLISGCVWDLRNELLVTEPANYRDIGASLFINMLIVRGQMLPGNDIIDPLITIIYLELDDDNGTIGDGTPHYIEIANAFGSHNMDAPPLSLIGFAYPSGRPENVSPTGGIVEFTVEVTDVTGTAATGTGVLHVDRGSGFEAFPMSESSPNVYEAVFPATTCGSPIAYYISAQATSGQVQQSPSGAPNDSFTALSAISLTTNFQDDFESDLGWSVSGNATDGQWDRGVPVGGGDRGDPPTDADGSGSCYLTDNVDDNSDVDGGSTTLTSPVMDASSGSGGDEALISYHRWYSNSSGNAPEADTFLVEISNDGGGSWMTLETVGPSGSEVNGGWYAKSFRIADFLPPTGNMRLRFTASDLGDGSVVEAGVDGVQVRLAGCSLDCNNNGLPDDVDISVGLSNDANGNDVPDECEGVATNYCSTAPNSVDATGALISYSGSLAIVDNNMSLSAGPVPDTFGIFFYGPTQVNQPFGQGFLCVGNPISRLLPPTVGSGNSATRALDFLGTSNENLLMPGDTANFQYWYRDPANGAPPNDFNLSDGLQVTFLL